MKLWMFDVERRVVGTRTDYEHAKQAVIAPTKPRRVSRSVRTSCELASRCGTLFCELHRTFHTSVLDALT